MIRGRHPDWSLARILDRRDEIIAAPLVDSDSPPPHATGAAFDTSIQYFGTNDQVFTVYGDMVPDDDAIHPDFLEHTTLTQALTLGITEKVYHHAKVVRRVVYNVTTSDEVGDIALVVNPMEVWHYSWGDQLWAQQTGAKSAIYGYAPESFQYPNPVHSAITQSES